jgi:hypothetical protein
MKIQIDITNKTIQVEGSVNLKELLKQVKVLLPKGLWKEFELVQDTVVHWTNPIVIEPYRPYQSYYPTYPWITYDSGSTPMLGDGTFCVDIPKINDPVHEIV